MGYLLSRLYYGKSKGNNLTIDETVILQIKQCRDKIKNYIKKLEKDESLNKEKAKEMLRKSDREKAKIFLNKSKVCSTYIENYQNQLNMIEDQLNNIQMTKQQKETFDVLQKGNQVLKELQREVNLERLENISEELNELKQSQEEVANFLKTYKINSEEFDAEVDKDLENMMRDNENQDNNIQKISELSSNYSGREREVKRDAKVALMN
jgi:charged multivesicular body protein 6